MVVIIVYNYDSYYYWHTYKIANFILCPLISLLPEWMYIESNASIDSAAAAAKLLQSCLTLCDPIDGSPPGSPVLGILQERMLEWVAISFSSAWKWKVKVKSLSRVRLLATPWTATHQAPPSMGFSRLGYWSGVPLPSPLLTLEQIISTYGPQFILLFWKN